VILSSKFLYLYEKFTGMLLLMKKLLFFIFLLGTCAAQQTVMNISSADTVGKGKFYYQGTFTYQPTPAYFDMGTTLVYGMPHNLEFELDGLNTIHPYSPMVVAPGIKWAFLKKGSWVLYSGDLVYLPVNRSFARGNYLYTAGAFSKGRFRLTFGGWDSQNAVRAHNHAGALGGLEFTAKKFKGGQAVPACDWQSGSGSNGILACGVSVYFADRFMLSPGYQMGNYGATQGNHQAFIQLGLMLK
jgi:hypothetical protein